jgi:hypothetical protein
MFHYQKNTHKEETNSSHMAKIMSQRHCDVIADILMKSHRNGNEETFFKGFKNVYFKGLVVSFVFCATKFKVLGLFYMFKMLSRLSYY